MMEYRNEPKNNLMKKIFEVVIAVTAWTAIVLGLPYHRKHVKSFQLLYHTYQFAGCCLQQYFIIKHTK